MRSLKQLLSIALSFQEEIICAKFKGIVYLKVTEREYNEVCLETMQCPRVNLSEVKLCDLPLKVTA